MNGNQITESKYHFSALSELVDLCNEQSMVGGEKHYMLSDEKTQTTQPTVLAKGIKPESDEASGSNCQFVEITEHRRTC